jgi:hypothetical protein
MPQVRFDSTVNLGHVLTFVGFLLAGLGAYWGARIELSLLDRRMSAVEIQITKMSDVLVKGATQDVRIDNIEKRLDRLEPRSRHESEAR